MSYFDSIVSDCVKLIKHFNEVLVCLSIMQGLACSLSGPREWFNIAPSFIDCTIALEKF